jgi:ppGpp synthetase/RelA/SpoT-type nucleotidyltranferase
MESSQTIALANEVERCIAKLGIMHRIFFREKTEDSLDKKINSNPGKYGANKKIQDLIGIRIALYFMDDIAIAHKALAEKFEFVPSDSQIDEPGSEIFKAIRCNLIFKLPEYFDFSSSVHPKHANLIDNTFEVQLRTILSEGWHEIDHDLRYKCNDDWAGLERENRALNGVYATLETSEWTLLKLFEELAYTHYKSANLRAMLNNKFRVRLKPSTLDENVITHVKNRPDLIKKIYRFDRSKILNCLSCRPYIPLSMANLIFIMNLESVGDPGIYEMMPQAFRSWWESAASTQPQQNN